jgi:hypothetical protein
MNNNDLERRLRTETGPREEGYVAARLPATQDEGARRRRSPVLRAAVLVPAVAAGILAVAVAGALLRDDGNVNVGGARESSPAVPTPPGRTDCAAEDLVLAAEPWGGAAGSRGTLIIVTLAGTNPCWVSVHSAARLMDATGATVIETSVGLRNIPPLITLQPNGSYSIGVSWSNWCEAPPSLPVSLTIRPPSIDSWLPVPIPPDGADPVPPCMGSNDTALNLTQLQPAH